MPDFVDATGQTWEVAIDGLSLAELKEKANVDLVQEGLYVIEEREDVLTKSLIVLCREQIDERKLTPRQFARLICGETTDKAIDAVRGAARLFFRPSKWSEIQSRSDKRRDADRTYQELLPMLGLLNRPDMPAALREAVMGVIGDTIEKATDLRNSEGSGSASGLGASQANAAGGYPDSLASVPTA